MVAPSTTTNTPTVRSGVLSSKIPTRLPQPTSTARGYPPATPGDVKVGGMSGTAADLLVARQRLLALRVVLDDRRRIVAGRFRERPRLVDLVGGQRVQLRDPTPHVGAVRVELLPLQHRVEDAEVRRG